MTAVLESLAPASAILDPLLSALHRLDHLLEAAVARAQRAAGSADAGDDGLPATPARRADGSRLHVPSGDPGPLALLGGQSRLGWLADAFSLEPFDVDLVVLALAPEVDLRYERLYAYLHDDLTRRRPTAALALELLCDSTAERVARRRHFSASAPLLRHRLLLPPADAAAIAPLGAQPLVLDPQIANLLLGLDALDSRIARWCTITDLDDEGNLDDAAGIAEPMRSALPPLLRRAASAAEPCVVYLHGAAGVGKERASLAVAGAAGLAHMTIDVAALLATDADAAAVLALALRDAWLRDAVPYLRGAEALWRDERLARRVPLAALLDEHLGPVLLGGSRPWVAGTAELTGIVEVAVEMPDVAARRRIWAASLAAAELDVPNRTVDTLASRFRLATTQIEDAVMTAARRLAAQSSVAGPADHTDNAVPTDSGGNGAPQAGPLRQEAATTRELFACARAETGHQLAELATRVPVCHTWRDLVLPDDVAAQLREICQRVIWRERVLGAWGFGARLSRGRGIAALFAGPSGTGKTMAAEVIAGELGLDLYRVELAGVVSKYIGETEKNLDRIFAAAEQTNAILLFDEADALFGKRSEVRDAHDRYANIEVSYLLQRMESYEGVAILATNLRGNLDAAFVRRLAFTVAFPFPDVESRRRIWERIWPDATPIGDDVDFGALAERFPLSGGNIRNIALAAAFLAAERDTAVTLDHLRHATNREYQKLGKTLSAEELG